MAQHCGTDMDIQHYPLEGQSGVRLQKNYYQTQQSGVRQTLPKPKPQRSGFSPLGGLPPKARISLSCSPSVYLSDTLIPTYVPVTCHISTCNCQRTDNMIPTYLSISTCHISTWNCRRTEHRATPQRLLGAG